MPFFESTRSGGVRKFYIKEGVDALFSKSESGDGFFKMWLWGLLRRSFAIPGVVGKDLVVGGLRMRFAGESLQNAFQVLVIGL